MSGPIVVPLDGSELADRVVPQLRRLLAHRAAEVALLTVVERGPSKALRARRREEARVHLERIRAALAADGVSVTTAVRFGDPAEEITACARAAGAWLVAMASHGRTGVARWARGSVAERVIRSSATPVLVLSPGAQAHDDRAPSFGRILVPLDGSALAAEVLPLVEELALAHESEVLLLICEWVMPAISEPYPVPLALRTPEELAAILEPQREALRARGIPTRVLTAFAPEAESIVAAAERERADLVAMSTHGRGGLSRWLLGSVAEEVVRRCGRPLLVRRANPVPSPAPTATTGGAR